MKYGGLANQLGAICSVKEDVTVVQKQVWKLFVARGKIFQTTWNNPASLNVCHAEDGDACRISVRLR